MYACNVTMKIDYNVVCVNIQKRILLQNVLKKPVD